MLRGSATRRQPWDFVTTCSVRRATPRGLLAPLVAGILDRANARQNRLAIRALDPEPERIAERARAAGFDRVRLQRPGDRKNSVLLVADRARADGDR